MTNMVSMSPAMYAMYVDVKYADPEEDRLLRRVSDQEKEVRRNAHVPLIKAEEKRDHDACSHVSYMCRAMSHEGVA